MARLPPVAGADLIAMLIGTGRPCTHFSPERRSARSTTLTGFAVLRVGWAVFRPAPGRIIPIG